MIEKRKIVNIRYGGNNYYFGDEYYDNQKNKLPVKCSVPFTQVSANDTAQVHKGYVLVKMI